MTNEDNEVRCKRCHWYLVDGKKNYIDIMNGDELLMKMGPYCTSCVEPMQKSVRKMADNLLNQPVPEFGKDE